MKKILTLAALLALPAASFAATYDYVDTSGTVRTVQADTAGGAINAAPDRALHSGVAIDTGVFVAGDASVPGAPNTGFVSTSAGTRYNYVDVTGIVRTINAPSADVALTTAPARAYNSGVAVDTGTLDVGVSVVNQ